MIKGHKIFLCWLLCIPATLFSQQLSRQVLVPLAGLATENAISYSQTVGETAIEIVGCSDYIFTQGFQQPGFKATSEESPKGTGVNVYPNPVSDFVTIELYSETARTFRIDFISITGNVVMSERKVFNDKFWYKDPLSLENLISGFYLVRVYSEDGVLNRTFKIEKL
ncbi:MAG: T9SS type A sorting domain-containing protein [Bacteroidales bacterium]